MSLLDLWNANRNQITEKRIEQSIAFAGEGSLRDGNTTSQELRSLLGIVPSALLGRWIEECSENRFADFGFVLQDIVNEIGQRLGQEFTRLDRIIDLVFATAEDAQNGEVLVSCQVSKEYRRPIAPFWFGLKRTTKEVLESRPGAFCAFALGCPELVVVIPFSFLSTYLDGLWTSPDADGNVSHWHIRFGKEHEAIRLLTDRDRCPVEVSQFMLRAGAPD